MSILGTPTAETWKVEHLNLIINLKDLETLPDYGKVVFHEQKAVDFETIFPNATKSELAFLKKILCYERPKTVKEV